VTGKSEYLFAVEIPGSVSGAGFEGAENASVGSGLVPALVRAPTRDAPTQIVIPAKAGIQASFRRTPRTRLDPGSSPG
jgi:hypothetical protein